MDGANEKLRKLKLRLQKEKKSKKSLKRKLKLKFAQSYGKLKAKLKSKAEMVRQLKTATDSNKSLESTSENLSTIELASDDRFAIENDLDHIDQMDEGEMSYGKIESHDIDRFDIQYIHSYAKNAGEKFSQMYFCCSNCKFKTTKKSNLVKHEETSCQREPVRDMKCPVCKKPFNYDGLRGHLRYFATGKHGAKNEHKKYTPLEHEMMLQKLKESVL